MDLTHEKNIDKRNSSIELLRIISMIMIIFHHFALHGGFNFISSSITIPKLWWNFIIMGGKVGVNVFVLISGYFLISNQKIELNFRKIFKLWGQVFFYAIIILLIFCLCGNKSIDFKIIIKSLFPIIFSLWGFASTYFVMYIIHPFINRLLRNLSRDEFKYLLALQFVCWSLIPTITGQLFQSNSLIWFVFLYCIAAYIKLYGSSFVKKTSYYFVSFIILYLLTYLSSVIFSLLGTKWQIFANHDRFFFGPEKITVLLISVTLFMTFVSMKLPYYKWVNKIASTTFGIYLLHDNPLTRNFLWNTVFQNNKFQSSIMIIPYSLFTLCIVFFICSIIDLLRQAFFKKLDNIKIIHNPDKFVNLFKKIVHKIKL